MKEENKYSKSVIKLINIVIFVAIVGIRYLFLHFY